MNVLAVIRMQQCHLKSIGKHVSCYLYRYISKMPTNIDKTKCTKSNEDANNSKSKNDVIKEKKSQFESYDCFLPDRKGNIKVCIIGGGETSIYTAVLLKQSRLIKYVHLVDAKDSMASAILDASHIDTSTRLKYFKRKQVKVALQETNIIALMDETDSCTANLDPKTQFEIVSAYVHEMAEQMVNVSSESLAVIFVRPVTATLSMVSEIYKLAGWWDPDRIIGSTALDRMRMEAATANLLDLNPAFLSIPMVGGADSNTIVPLLSRASPINRFTSIQQETLIQSLRNADKEMANIESRGPILSAAAAAAKLILALANGISGFENIVSSAFVRSNVLPTCRFFTNEVQFGVGGVQKNFGLPKMSSSEVVLLEQAIPLINEYIAMGMKAASAKTHVTQKNI